MVDFAEEYEKVHKKYVETYQELAAERELTGKLAEALAKCRDQFDYYVLNHMKKKPPDMDKAVTNQEFVELCDAALSLVPADRRVKS